ncbi:hypothetical protein CCR75_008970 [Bremia lactucae]|uniref:EF-hand domain-containing protein n=1 Tax=Bremia lactucae TaxID=4779 RepID=A0A976IK61_BRELC|nr:hypothetical protein CCR75_008970 [Bremia lactucae]
MLLLGSLVVFAAFGDIILTQLLRKFAGSVVGKEFCVIWSFRDGSLELRDLVLGNHVLPNIEPLLGLPLGFKRLDMKRLLFVLPFLGFLVRCISGRTARMESKLVIAGLHLGLTLDPAEKWMWKREENAERCDEAVKQAAKMRIIRVNNWTAVIVQKLKDLASLRELIRDADKQQSQKALEQEPPKSAFWHLWVDKLLNSFELRVQTFSLVICDEYSNSSVGIAIQELGISQNCSIDENRLKRSLRLVNYEMFLNPKHIETANVCHLIAPLTMEIGVIMPFIFQSLVMGQGNVERAFELEILFSKDQALEVQLRPAQASMLLNLLQPINYYYDWQTAASIADDLACIQLEPSESEEYMSLFIRQWQLDNDFGFLRRLIEGFMQKEMVVKRMARLDELESKMLAMRLLYLRSLSLGWTIPNGGSPLPFVSEEDVERGNLRHFIENSVDHYVDKNKIPATPPTFHLLRLSLKMSRMNTRLIMNNEKKLMTFFVHDVSFEMHYRMTKTDKNDTMIELALDAARFGLLDDRGAASNVFCQVMDRNPEADDMLGLVILQRGDGYMDIGVKLKHLSLLLVFDPLLFTLYQFLPAIGIDEKEQMRFIAHEMANCMDSPEHRDAVKRVYVEDLPKQYSPLMLGGMPIGCSIILHGCEFCLIGDFSTIKSPVLAFTADINLRVLSSERSEAVELELADVALTPCTIVLRDDGIELDIGEVRTILELEGEGVDFSMGYRIAVGELNRESSKLDNSALKGPAKSASSLWNVARKVASKPQVIEVDHPDIEEVEEHIIYRDRTKAGARRKLTMQVSDFAVNLSSTDLGILLSIVASLNESMKEDIEVIKKRQESEVRINKARRVVEENRYMNKLKKEFKLRDTDGGGTLDLSEIKSLIRSAADCDNLTKTEFDAIVADFVSIVDSDGSGDISFEEFSSALSRDKILYPRLHCKGVTITGQEYVHPDMQRTKVPFLSGDKANTLANAAALVSFWECYEEQVGASKSSLMGQRPITVQKKMVRTFKNYEYAQEAWNRIINPSLIKPIEQTPWLLSKEMNMGGRGDVIDQLLSILKDDDINQASLISAFNPEQQLFVQTVVSTCFGGFYMRMIDDMLPMGMPAIETSLEELGIYANFSVWEGGSSVSATEFPDQGRSGNNFGVAKISFNVYGNYYNAKVRQVEPFIEFYQGTLDIKKELESPLMIIYSSDRYFQFNVTSSFMEAVNTNVASFSKAEHRSEAVRPHVKEIGALFWLLNDSGVNVKYYMVSKQQKKGHVREEVVTAVTAVSTGSTHACTLLSTIEEEQYEQQSLKEKQLRQAFRSADQDGSGELDTEEVRAVLRSVYEEEDKQRRPSGSKNVLMRRRSSSCMLENESEFAKVVEDFIALADTDKSGQVSWEEFKTAIAKSRVMVERYLSVEIEGYQAIHGVPLMSIGQTQVYELTPFFEDVESEESIAELYDLGVALLTKIERPTRQELQKAYACLHRVKEMDDNYEWIDSYYADCMRQYLPVLAAIHISVDGLYGLQVKISGAEFIRNGTAKNTELLMYNELGDIACCNPKHNGGDNCYFMMSALGTISIPLNLVGAGTFAIRQTGETEWSNQLKLSVSDQRLYKKMTKFEQLEVQKAVRGDGHSSVLSAKRAKEKLGMNAILPDPNEFVPAGKEVVYPSSSCIDNQPTIVVETISANSPQLGTWSLTIQPQLVLHNVLPCGVEYAIVQAGDCPLDTLTNKKEFRITDNAGREKNSRSVKILGQIDYFSYVGEVNCRRMWIESGKSIQVFGLDLSKPALMKIRHCASETSRAATWSAPFLVHLETSRQSFNEDAFKLHFSDGPNFVFHPQWEENAARSVYFYTPFWIQNRSGLDLRFKLSRGRVCTIEEHRLFFPDAKEIPLMVVAPPDKALLSVRPYQVTPNTYEGESLMSETTAKCLPNFDKLGWSDPVDLATVSRKGELRPSGSGDYSFVFAYEIRAAPAQFFRSKIIVISPRFIFLNHSPRLLQMTPIILDKKGNRGRAYSREANCTVKEGEAVVIYHLIGPEKYVAGLRIRDMTTDSQEDVGNWSPNLPLFKLASKLSDPNVAFNIAEETVFWTRGSLGNGPVCSVSTRETAETIFVTVKDVSASPNYRIENRSTRYSFRYVQRGVKTAEELVLKPLESHSFAWEDPTGDMELRVTASHWKIPTLVDFMRIGEVKHAPEGLFGEVYIDGSTRVFALGDTKVYSEVRRRAISRDWLSNTVIDVSMHGLGITLVDEQPQEILNITMENIRFDSKTGSRRVCLMVHHVQFDDMTPHAVYPVVFAPVDSGFNSDKREGWLPGDGERPFFTLSFETLPQSGIVIVNDFDLQVEPMTVKLNLEYLLGINNLLFQFIPGSDEATILQQGLEAKNAMLQLNVPFPDNSISSGMLMYFKRWRMSGYELDLVFDSLQEDKGEGISAILGTTMGSIVGGIAHVTPEFHFGEIVYYNRFFYEYDLIYDVVLKIVYSVIGQWYKIVGSVEMLGDPVGLATDIVDGFALAARQLKRDIKGKSRRKGESAITVVQTVFGVPLRSIGKVSNGLGDVVKKATYFKSQEDTNEPRHIPEGFVQSGKVLGKSIAYGVSGFVKEPVRGAKRGGFKGFAKGVGRGTLQLVASPVVGTLGVVEKMSQSMSNTTHLMDEKPFNGTRRPARNLQAGSLKQLSDSNVITEVEVHCLYIEGLPDNVSPKVVVRVYSQTNGYPATELGLYKSSTARHTGTPTYDQSWLVGVSSIDTFIEVNVYHKRKPLPKKRLGYVRFSMEEIFREFESIPAKLLADTNVKMQLKRRKRVRGSIICKLASASEHRMEIRDDSWRQRLNRAPKSGSSFLSEDEDEGFEDYDQEVSVLSGSSICLDSTFPPSPVGFPLQDCETEAKIYLSIRYVNDMRRYA